MAPEVAALIEAGLELDPDERAVVANVLLKSLHHGSEAEQGEVDEAWSEEISSRLDEVLEGKVQLVDADEHYERLRAEVAARRK